MSLEWQTGKVVNIIDETPATRRYFIETPSTTPFDFKPGQFVTLDLPIHEKKNKRWRSYSIASSPNGTNIFELVIVLVEDGLGTPFLFNNIQVGDEISLRGPAGVFVLPEKIEHDYFMICTGTGIAPFRSMAQYLFHHQLPTKEIYLIFGTRTKADLLYYDELTTLQEKFPQFNYIPVLSRESWEGKKGYVHDVYTELCAGKPDAQFLLCGWKNMIDDAKNKLLALGYDKKQIHFELYG
ncbi:MAG: ferredoxin--NADP reductase [Chitinophagaceae bacterium]|nr:ferredoxin--NADP reductase [Chitinophagaceae bacterium]